MTYRIIYTRRAQKDISKLAPEIRENIGNALEKYSDSPLDFARKMVDSELGTYRFRVGDYRIIFDIEDANIVVLRVGHHRDIYSRK